MGLKAVPMTITRAKEYIAQEHRHHKPPQGALFAVGVSSDDHIVGVATVGRPVARMLDDGHTAEVSRLCTNGHRNACSKLYAMAWRICREMGFQKLITYILEEESGVSLKAAGWRCIGEAGGGSWSRPSRKRDDKAPLEKKQRWEILAR